MTLLSCPSGSTPLFRIDTFIVESGFSTGNVYKWLQNTLPQELDHCIRIAFYIFDLDRDELVSLILEFVNQQLLANP